MLNTFTIALGGAIGSVMRHWFSGLIARVWGETFPWGTIIVNISGCFVITVLIFTLTASTEGRVLVGPVWRNFLMIGICGGYTTFSSFSLQTLNLANDGQWFRAGANVVVSVVLCLIAVWLGHALALQINSSKGSLICKFLKKPFCCESLWAKANRFEHKPALQRRSCLKAREMHHLAGATLFYVGRSGIWRLQPFAYRQNSPAFNGSASRDRDC